MNNCDCSGHIESGKLLGHHRNLSNGPNNSQQNFTAVQLGSFVLGRYFWLNVHDIGKIQMHVTKVVDANNRYALADLRSRLNDTVGN